MFLSIPQPVLHKLLHTLEVKQSDSRVICATKKATKHDLVNHYSSHDLKAFLDIATYLDLRYKELPYYHDADSYKKVEKELYRKLDSLPAEMLPNHQAEQSSCDSNSDSAPPSKKKKGPMEIFFGNLFSEVSAGSDHTSSTTRNELTFYKSEVPAKLDSNPLEWWEKRQHLYPRLSQLVKWCFSLLGQVFPQKDYLA